MSLDPHRCPLPEHPEAEHAFRYVEALALGTVADTLFAMQCRKLGLDVQKALRVGPLVALMMATRSGGSDARH